VDGQCERLVAVIRRPAATHRDINHCPKYEQFAYGEKRSEDPFVMARQAGAEI